MANFSDAIFPAQFTGGAVSFPVGSQIEESGQTAVLGTPVQITAADGGLAAWSGTIGSNLIAGITMENFNNLGSTGLGAPVGFSPITSYGSVVGNYSANANQPSAVISPSMVPMSDGRIRFWLPAPTTVFIAKIGTSSTVTPVATAQSQVGASGGYGLKKDTGNNYWYVDTNTSGIVQIVALSPLEAVGTVGGHVLFVFLPVSTVVSLFN
jgi:hypothetical protein